MNKYQGSCWIGPVLFSWQYSGVPTDYVRVTWKGSNIVDELLPPATNPLYFSVHDSGDERQRVSGVLTFYREPAKLEVTSLSYPGGHVGEQVLFPDGPPPPPVPPLPDDEQAAVEIIVERPPESDLFPYLYLAQWPDITAAALSNRFVQYAADSAPQNSLYQQLIKAREQGRHAMLEQADLFLAEKPPYTGCYLRNIAALGAPMAQLSQLDEQFRRNPPIDLNEFKRHTEAALEMNWLEIREYWLSTPYSDTSERAWQNLFALSAQPGFNWQLTDQLLRTLALATLIARIVASEPEPPESEQTEEVNEIVPLKIESLWPAERLDAGIRSTVILPGSVFPLPPVAARKGDAIDISPVPYAIGDLKLVRQRLRRYELGEVSGIENVMRGEYKESSEKRLRELRTEELESDSGEQQAVRELSGQRQDLLAETLNTLKENFQYHYESQYGPPAKQLTVIVDGTVQPVDGEPQKTANSDAISAARLLTQRAAGSMARRLHWQRSSASINRDEVCTLWRIDAGQMETNVRAIYRWVNKVYQCWTVALGKRFILEFFVRNPAQGYIAGSFSLRGLSLREPPALIDFGVKTFQDISIDPESPAYYAKLAAEYDVVELQPPPEPHSLSSIAFQEGEPLRGQSIPIAPGYSAASAKVAVSPAPGDDGLQLSVSVGQQRYEYPPAGGDGGIAELQLDGQTGLVPAAVLSAKGAQALQISCGYSVAIEIKANLSEQALNQWKLATFKSIAAGCARARERYYEMVGAWPSQLQQPSSLSIRELVRSELRRDIVRQLIRHVETLTGESGNIALGRERYVQFLERALAWREMAYAFTVKTEDDIGTSISQQYRGEDELFSAFLQAGSSRVLLPVTPDFAYRMLYFLASGQIWPGVDSLTPALCPEEKLGEKSAPDFHYINLVNALKESADCESAIERQESWELVVPTDMTVLQEGSQLPVFVGEEL